MFCYQHAISENNYNAHTTKRLIIPNSHSEVMLHEQFINNYASGLFINTPKTLETEKIMKIVTTNLKISPSNIETAISEHKIIKKFKTFFHSQSKTFQV